MHRKWALLKASDTGPMGRGQAGKKKVYEITVSDNVVTFEWGMAELTRRQRQVRVCRSHQAALGLAYEKLGAKTGGGYQIAYAV